MTSSAPPGHEVDWASRVRVREDPVLNREIEGRLARSSGLRPVAVTDLLALRKAFWRLASPPVAVAAERQERMEVGRAWHRQVGRVLARTGSLEVRIRRDGFVGRIDVLTDRAVEVKTSTLAVAAERLVEDRPDFVEQLGMYSALVGRSVGRLVSLEVRGDRVEGVRSFDLAFGDPESILGEMRHRAGLLRESWEERRADVLPRCPFYDRGCEYRAAGVCDCTGAEEEAASRILGEVSAVRPVPEEDRRLREALSTVAIAPGPAPVARFRELVYPRRAYFERTHPRPPAEEWISPLDVPPDAYGRLVEAIETGPIGEVARLPSLASEPDEEVAAFRGEPFLVRSSRARVPPAASELVPRAPQYALELGFRCAVTGRSSGRVVAVYGAGDATAGPSRVFELEFDSVTSFARLWRTRLDAFVRALANGTPETLVPCPDWMYATCPYRDECACSGATGRSQR